MLCRAHVSQCDQRPGTCLNCEKASRECGGYRNAVDMMFLDETEIVSKKMKADLSIQQSMLSKDSLSPPAPIKPASIPRQIARTFATLPPELESQATTVFYTYFALDKQSNESKSTLFATVSPDSPLPGARALYHSMVALGLASMAIHTSADSGLSEHAEAQYLTAISALSPAVSSPTEVKSDQTLLAVMVLTIFETFSLPAPSQTSSTNQVTNLTAWSNHVSGAAALLEARGIEQFETQQGARLFAQAAIPLCVNCMQAGKLIPPIIPQLLEEAKAREGINFTSVVTAPWRSLQMIIQFTDFIVRVRQRQITDLLHIMEAATTMDGEAHSILTNMPQYADRQVVTNITPLDQYEDMLPLGYCHAYSSFMASEITNGLRAFRLQLNGLMRDCLLIGMTRRPPLFTDPSDYQLLQSTTENLRTISDEIIASVPQYLGYIPTTLFATSPPTTTLNPPGSRATTPIPSGPNFLWSPFPPPPPHLPLGALPLVRSAAGCHMPWALMTVAVTDVATPETQAWVARRLQQVSEQCHVQQAAALARRVREGSWVEGWWRGVCPKDGLGWRDGGGERAGSATREESVEGGSVGGGSQLGD